MKKSFTSRVLRIENQPTPSMTRTYATTIATEANGDMDGHSTGVAAGKVGRRGRGQ